MPSPPASIASLPLLPLNRQALKPVYPSDYRWEGLHGTDLVVTLCRAVRVCVRRSATGALVVQIVEEASQGQRSTRAEVKVDAPELLGPLPRLSLSASYIAAYEAARASDCLRLRLHDESGPGEVHASLDGVFSHAYVHLSAALELDLVRVDDRVIVNLWASDGDRVKALLVWSYRCGFAG